jgi:hypothetical protein
MSLTQCAGRGYVAVILALCAGCGSEPPKNLDHAMERSQCNHLATQEEREQCFRANTTYEDYKREQTGK